jgi:hypothetical protein
MKGEAGMRRIAGGLALFGGLVMLSVGAVALGQGGGHTPVTICHHAGPNPENWHTITVDDDSVTINAHLAHGDTLGACETTTTTTPTETTPTETTPTETQPPTTTETVPTTSQPPAGATPGTTPAGATPGEQAQPGSPAEGATPGTPGVNDVPASQEQAAPQGELAFTGLPLIPAMLVGFGLLGAGLALRREPNG